MFEINTGAIMFDLRAHEHFPPAVFIRNGFRLLLLYLMKKRGEDPPRLP